RAQPAHLRTRLPVLGAQWHHGREARRRPAPSDDRGAGAPAAHGLRAEARRVRARVRRPRRRGARGDHARPPDRHAARVHAQLPARAPARARRVVRDARPRPPAGRRRGAGGGGRRGMTELRTALEAGLGHRFARPEHLQVAVTHRSSSGEAANNETLEFLGDAVLALAMADLPMRRFPTAREGDLSKLRAGLVDAETLATKARALDLGRWLRLGKGEEKSGGREKESILAAVYEALLGAVYLAAWFEAARRVVEAHFAADVTTQASAGRNDYKTRLQELTQRLFRATPVY